jgi:hypothetical protein
MKISIEQITVILIILKLASVLTVPWFWIMFPLLFCLAYETLKVLIGLTILIISGAIETIIYFIKLK